jgi:Zn finger protein HypA/HybF involved in hydrogenase expression
MKMTRLTKIGLGALAVGLAAWVVLTLATNDETRIGPAADGQHCPECGQELPKGFRGSGSECPYCKASGKSTIVGRGRADGGSGLRGPAIPLAIVGAAVVLLLVHVVFLVRNRARGQQEEVLFYTNCRKCLRKLRYRERQVGQLAKCPLCHTVIRFPEPEGALKARWPTALFGKILGR